MKYINQTSQSFEHKKCQKRTKEEKYLFHQGTKKSQSDKAKSMHTKKHKRETETK